MSKRLVLAMLLLALNLYSVGSIKNEHIVRVNNYVHHDLSGVVCNTYRFATAEEKALAVKKAELELIWLQNPKPILEVLGDAIAGNYNYLVSVKPFGVPYGFPIAAVIVIGYGCYKAYTTETK